MPATWIIPESHTLHVALLDLCLHAQSFEMLVLKVVGILRMGIESFLLHCLDGFVFE